MNTIQTEEDIEILTKNYLDMDETGREKLKEVSEKVLDIWETVQKEKPENRE